LSGRFRKLQQLLISSSLAPSNTGVAIGTPFDQIARELHQVGIAQAVRIFLLAACLVVDPLMKAAQIGQRRLSLQHLADLQTDTFGRPAQVRLEYLADVHSRRHAKRIHKRCLPAYRLRGKAVLDRNDRGNDTLVPVAAGHLVARLYAAL